MMPESPSVDPELVVVVLNWNGKEDTIRCIESIIDVESFPDHLITVVDNASDDDSVEVLSNRYPGVRILQSYSNLGFAGGMNLGLAHALASGASYVCVLNNDTVVTPGMFSALIDVARDGVATSPE